AARKRGDRLVLPNVVGKLRDVESFRVVNAAFPVDDGDNLCALFGQQLCRDTADVTVALHGDAGSFEVEPEMLRRFARGDHHAASGRFAAAERSAELERFAGD